MKSKLVIWGQNPAKERVLFALELLEEENKVKTFVFPEHIVTAEFEDQLHTAWKENKEVAFPEGYEESVRELSLIGDILPEGHTCERDDLLKRAQAEWHFVVLSSKLYNTYRSEIEEFRDRVEQAERYSSQVWDELKGFWDKIQRQMQEKNLFRSHANALRDETNLLFTRLKEKRKDMDKEFQETSRQNFEQFSKKLDDLLEKVSKGLSLHVLFDDLKRMQQELKDLKLVKDHRNKIWNKLDDAFKQVKDKRFGGNAGESGGDKEHSPANRLERRLTGLNDAIDKMEKSIHRDRQEMDFQDKRAGDSAGMLESQLREAKVKMVEERIASKQQKLDDMKQTQAELVQKLSSIQQKEQRRQELEEAKKHAQEKIAAEIRDAAEGRKEVEGKLEKAAAAIADNSREAESTDVIETGAPASSEEE